MSVFRVIFYLSKLILISIVPKNVQKISRLFDILILTLTKMITSKSILLSWNIGEMAKGIVHSRSFF